MTLTRCLYTHDDDDDDDDDDGDDDDDDDDEDDDDEDDDVDDGVDLVDGALPHRLLVDLHLLVLLVEQEGQVLIFHLLQFSEVVLTSLFNFCTHFYL